MFRENLEERREKTRRSADRSRRGWKRTRERGEGGINYCPCIRRSLPIVVDSFVSLVLVPCLWQPWNPLSRLSSLLLSDVVGGDTEETAGVPVKGKPERRTFGKELRTDGEIGPDPEESSRGIIARIAAKVTSRWTANVGVYHSERR